MNRLTAALTAVGLVIGVSCLTAPPAAADSFFFGYSSGYRHYRPHHWRPRHPHYWGPRHHYSYYYYPPPPPPVVYVPPPVVYSAPPPVVYSAPPPLAAVPTSPVYRASNGQYCREYQGTVRVDGVPQPSYGTACLQPDGTWRVVN